MEHSDIKNKYRLLKETLMAQMNPEGFWTGRLSSSALATAVAMVSLKKANNNSDADKIETGFQWLCRHVNADGGFGDTPRSVSNVSTTLLCYAAIRYCQPDETGKPVLEGIEKWLQSRNITTAADQITRSILRFYGKDYTFSIPILGMLHLCDVIPDAALDKIPVLPFELALLPASWYRFLNLRVVSYALPALIGVGLYLHIHRNRKLKSIHFRNIFIDRAIRKLDSLVPSSGGFLEAIPLTGFVSMCLTACGKETTETVSKGLQFLRNQQRDDGSWPIDTDLSTWVTTLSIKALGPDVKQTLSEVQVNRLRNHLLQIQFKTIHPFNGAKPGGWGWTSFSGSVPDADDTPGAILALLEIYAGTPEENIAIEQACSWLMDLQNRDGGFPTFCKGWGKLPFDKSCADLTGHALLALVKASEKLAGILSSKTIKKIDQCIRQAIVYLRKHQSPEGAWNPLWFGNQFTSDQTNPVYGTAKVGIYMNDTLTVKTLKQEFKSKIAMMAEKARIYLLSQQNEDGSWGGMKGITGSMEETSLAATALAVTYPEQSLLGLEWLGKQEKIISAPIGLYFAMLWYDEALYPLVYYIEALRRFSSSNLNSLN